MIGIKQGVEWFLRGGPVMWPLLLCSMASLALILDRFAFFIGPIRTAALPVLLQGFAPQ